MTGKKNFYLHTVEVAGSNPASPKVQIDAIPEGRDMAFFLFTDTLYLFCTFYFSPKKELFCPPNYLIGGYQWVEKK